MTSMKPSAQSWIADVSVLYSSELESYEPSAMESENCWKKASEVDVTSIEPTWSQVVSAS